MSILDKTDPIARDLRNLSNVHCPFHTPVPTGMPVTQPSAINLRIFYCRLVVTCQRSLPPFGWRIVLFLGFHWSQHVYIYVGDERNCTYLSQFMVKFVGHNGPTWTRKGCLEGRLNLLGSLWTASRVNLFYIFGDTLPTLTNLMVCILLWPTIIS